MEKYSWDDLCRGADFFHLDHRKFDILADFFHTVDHEFFSLLVSKTFSEDIEYVVQEHFSQKEQFRLLLLLIIANCEKMINLYKTKGYPDKSLDEISYDLALWMQKMEADFGGWGLTWRIFCWQRDCISGKVKQFGRLQCNDIHYFEPHCTFAAGGNSVSHGDPCINIHIPANGALDIGQCLESLRAMADFSAKFNPDFEYKAFVCYSWLLDPQFKQLLPADSNIIRFQNLGHNFILPDTDETHEVIWRLWDKSAEKIPFAQLSCSTSLQRNTAEFLCKGGRFREGVIVIFREEFEKTI